MSSLVRLRLKSTKNLKIFVDFPTLERAEVKKGGTMKLNPRIAMAVLVVILVGLVSWIFYTENVLPVACLEPTTRIEVRNTAYMDITQIGERGMLEVVNLTGKTLYVQRAGGFFPDKKELLHPGEIRVIPCGRGRIIGIYVN